MQGLAELLALQDGVVSRAQALHHGLAPHDLRRLVRRRELTRLLPGVYLGHTGEPTWLQRAWAAVLYAESTRAPHSADRQPDQGHAPGAALCDVSALRAADGPGRAGPGSGPIHIAVDHARTVAAQPGVLVHRVVDLEPKVLWNASPPRVRIEHAVLARAARGTTDFDLIRDLADAVQSRRTSAARLVAALDETSRIPRRTLLRDVLADIGDGACSVLEHGYLTRVERPHGLPCAGRQVRASSHGPIYRDVHYSLYHRVVELDGRHFHDTAAARAADLDRDLDATVDGESTTRLGWRQVHGTPCRTAERIGALLRRGGWTGALRRCSDCQ